MPQDLEVIVDKKISQRLLDAGIDDKKPFDLLFKLSTAKKMTLDKYGEEHWEEDNATQLKVVEMVLKLTGLLEKKVEDLPMAVVHKMDKDDIQRLENIARELKTLESRLHKDRIQQGIIDISDTTAHPLMESKLNGIVQTAG